eukprot:CAMPEP_0114502890 /NCGR_PEP_ID=MMETSP0109-20121206/9350_1 /TAXON_ID=29199 /ORGANISM="Chlorarachnion reptans, Strain CCCM449" /LENGTH=151 /DNA_ID=CAMNT_0001680871 /DNA_START=460 /DNA_END=912 /DNA_ORIENTATION=+
MVLYPSDTSIPVHEFLKKTQHEQKLHEEKEEKNRLNIVLLDATWSQTKSLKKFLARIQTNAGDEYRASFVHINLTKPSLFAPLRRQARKDGCSTIEAASCAFNELGEKEVSRIWIQTLCMYVDTICTQGRKDQVYGTFTKEEQTKMRTSVP